MQKEPVKGFQFAVEATIAQREKPPCIYNYSVRLTPTR